MVIVVLLSVAFFYCYYSEWHYAECYNAECRYAECYWVQCCGTLCIEAHQQLTQSINQKLKVNIYQILSIILSSFFPQWRLNY